MRVYLFTDDVLNDDELSSLASYFIKNKDKLDETSLSYFNRNLSKLANPLNAENKSSAYAPNAERTDFGKFYEKKSNKQKPNAISDDEIISLARQFNLSVHNINKIMQL